MSSKLEEKSSFPNIPLTHWWKLREKFKQTIPTSVNPGYISAALSMKENSAKANIMPPLIAFGIIDENGKPKERAISWRDDEKYSEICNEIRNEIYPNELLEALPPPTPDREGVIRWFSNRTGAGEVAVKKMSTTYLLICEADSTKSKDVIKQTKNINEKKPMSQKKQISSQEKSLSNKKDFEAFLNQKNTDLNVQCPSLHIDIQIHISPDTSPELIDNIFSCMAKHLYPQKISHE